MELTSFLEQKHGLWWKGGSDDRLAGPGEWHLRSSCQFLSCPREVGEGDGTTPVRDDKEQMRATALQLLILTCPGVPGGMGGEGGNTNLMGEDLSSFTFENYLG